MFGSISRLAGVAAGGVVVAWLGFGLGIAPRTGGAAERDSRASQSLDLSGRPVDPFREAGAKAIVLVFISTDCPISNRYAPEIRRLHAQYTARGVQFWLVYPDRDALPDAIRKHVSEYQLPPPVLRDPQHFLVRKAKARVTPEAAVFVLETRLVYHGRIDDRYVDFGKERPAPTRRDLEEVLDAILDGKPVTKTDSPAVGCYIPELP